MCRYAVTCITYCPLREPAELLTISTTMSLVLAVNAGSSSLKISLFHRSAENAANPVLLLSSSTSSIFAPPAKFRLSFIAYQHRSLNEEVDSIHDHASAFTHFLDRLKEEASVDLIDIKHVAHRVVHGGDYISPVMICKESYHHIKRLYGLAPLHNGSALAVIKLAVGVLPHAKSIAFFDSAFHKDIPAHVATYAINQQVAHERGLRKYGFHGLSYAFMLRAVAAHLNKAPNTLNIIALHIGSGASMCAIRNGQSIDTSMGLTPLSGLPGATRAGDIDASLIFHYSSGSPARMSQDPSIPEEAKVTEAEEILNLKSGWKGLTGTADFKEITEKANTSIHSDPISRTADPNTLAFRIMLDRILHFAGAYHLALHGDVDALVFAGGVGERSAQLRCAVGEAVACLGFTVIDETKNSRVNDDEGIIVDIGRNDGRKRMLVCHTDEQLEMARECSLADQFWT
ncbi:Acetokinase family-domain-containing protein [Suillus bovinus]|uniref:Acetokinase family-domain-containing protein n=1 Tax=Suillus bovinus TaxID=48563 RepID=UPI001B85CEFE|nr:Acetokinase family-domain-containing protein [Suillus bovinus]KAG2157892.1 Acetokinase family-domain-containing protein [Suillus bovinus]